MSRLALALKVKLFSAFNGHRPGYLINAFINRRQRGWLMDEMLIDPLRHYGQRLHCFDFGRRSIIWESFSRPLWDVSTLDLVSTLPQ